MPDMHTILYSHPACLTHDPGPMHPECPDRLRAVLQALEQESFMLLNRREAPRAEIDAIARVHPRDYVEGLLNAIPSHGERALDADTRVSPGSGEAALRAAGAAVGAVDSVMAGEARNAFCAVRPPGHHAEPARAMGFCLFNNVAVAAAHARAAHGLKRVAVMDFDVHHGNGTEAMFRADPDLFYASTHQMPLYPGTGSPDETGVSGNIVNAPLPPMAGSGEFRVAMSRVVIPALREFEPEFLIVSAGFDAHMADPLAQLRLTEADFAWATAELMRVAAEFCDSRLISTLEGGYDLTALARSAAAHVRTLMEA